MTKALKVLTIEVCIMACNCLGMQEICHIGKGRTLIVAFSPQKSTKMQFDSGQISTIPPKAFEGFSAL